MKGKKMQQTPQNSEYDYRRIEQAINFLETNYRRQPELKEVAENLHLSEFHFQRLFRRWAGISPKRFVQFLTKEHARTLLDSSQSVLDAAYETGLSGPSRLHDLFVQCEAVTPGEYKSGGEGLDIQWGVHVTPFGQCLLAITGRGICGMQFLLSKNAAEALAVIKERYPKASYREDQKETQLIARQLFKNSAASTGRQSERNKKSKAAPVPLLINGTNFQIKVWESLLQLPPGTVISYEALAARIGKPGSTRAVANAVASNIIQYIIPCHRVIRKAGGFGGYQGGKARKMAILLWEAAKT